MESRITKKKHIEQSHFITSMTPEYPVDVLMLQTEIVGSKELFEWGKSKIDLLQEKLFKIPSSKLAFTIHEFSSSSSANCPGSQPA